MSSVIPRSATKAWTVHVTWYGDTSHVRYSKNKRMVILRPSHEDVQQDAEFVPLELTSGESALAPQIFESAVSSIPGGSCVTGRLSGDNYPTRPGAVLFCTRNLSATKCLVQGLVRMTRQPIPMDEPIVRDSLDYCAVVAKFIEKLYEELMRLNAMDEGSEETRCLLKVVFHGKETAPAFAVMKLRGSFDNALAVYLMHDPVLGSVLLDDERAAARSAKEMGTVQNYWYSMEKRAIKDADFFITILPGAWFKVAKRHYGRRSDNSKYVVKGKCKDISIKQVKQR